MLPLQSDSCKQVYCRKCCAQGIFFREHWAEFDAEISNAKGRMLRVNDAELSLHEVYGKRPEALANGFTLINVPEDLFGLQGAVRCYLKPNHPDLKNNNLQDFEARVQLQPPGSTLVARASRPCIKYKARMASPRSPGTKASTITATSSITTGTATPMTESTSTI